MDKHAYRYLHLVGFCSFAIGQPILERLGSNPEFFMTRGSGLIDLLFLAFALLALLPLFLALVEIPFFGLNKELGRFVHCLFLTMLTAAGLLPMLAEIPVYYSWFGLAASLLVAVTLVIFILRFEEVQKICAALSVLAIYSAVFFVTRPGMRELSFAQQSPSPVEISGSKKNIPVVLVVFDEFPLGTLLNAEHGIDSPRFPNFAAFADQSHWFRNATAVSNSIALGLPPILTGKLPTAEHRLPSYRTQPNNLFSLLGPSYDMHVWEFLTRMCPDDICKRAPDPRTRFDRFFDMLHDVFEVVIDVVLPPRLGIAGQQPVSPWGGFWEAQFKDRWHGADYRRRERVKLARQWIREISPSERPTLHFINPLLPRMPLQFLPSGKLYSLLDYPPAYHNESWGRDDWSRRQAYQQLIMQVGACDTFLGELVSQLKASGLYDKSLIVVAADHGMAFDQGTSRHGSPDLTNFYEDVLSVPLFIKMPGQHRGVRDDRNVETIDILPTIAEGLEISIPWTTDGSSALAESTPSRSVKTFVLAEPGAGAAAPYTPVHLPLPDKLPDLRVLWKMSQIPVGSKDTTDPFLLSQLPSLVGQLAPSPTGEIRHRISLHTPILSPGPDGRPILEVVENSGFVPSVFSGTLHLAAPSTVPPRVAVVLDGKIVQVTSSFQQKSSEVLFFESVLPETYLTPGIHTLDLLVVQGDAEPSLQFEAAELSDVGV